MENKIVTVCGIKVKLSMIINASPIKKIKGMELYYFSLLSKTGNEIDMSADGKEITESERGAFMQALIKHQSGKDKHRKAETDKQ